MSCINRKTDRVGKTQKKREGIVEVERNTEIIKKEKGEKACPSLEGRHG